MALLWRVKSDLTLPPLEFFPDGSYRSVVVNPKVRGHVISALICTAATAASIDPDRVKFKRTVRIIRRRAADSAFPLTSASAPSPASWPASRTRST